MPRSRLARCGDASAADRRGRGLGLASRVTGNTFLKVISPLTLRAVWVCFAVVLAGATSLCAQTASPFLSGVWCGNVTPTSASVSVRLNASGLRARLVVSTNDRLTPAVFSNYITSAAASGNSVVLDIQGLQPGTDYDYGIEVAGVVRTEANSRGKFRTFPQGASSFRLAFASCGDFRDPDQRAFDAILAEQPLLLLHMGDLHYSDTNSTVAEDHRRDYDGVLNHRNQGALYRGVALAYMWDDHDFSGNDSDGTSLGGAAARIAYRDTVPHYPISVTGGTIAQAFTVGRVRVIMTDLHSAASSSSVAESTGKTRMGAAQKAWFKQELIAARDAGFPLILWVSTTPWIGAPQLGSDSWAGYATERSELAGFFRDNLIKNLVVLSGDMHALAYDDGSNSDYAVGGGAPLVVLQSSPLTRPPEIKGGPYAAGPVLGTAQYALLEITDTGGPTIQCRYVGKRVGEGAKLVFQFAASTTGIVPTGVSGPVGGTDRAFVNVSTRGRIANPNEALIVGFVIGGTTSRNVLARAIGPSLAAFDVADALSRPVLTLYRGDTVIASNENWNTTDTALLTKAFDRVGAFRLVGTDTPDSAVLATLAPGPYTLKVTGADGTTGSVLIEAYEVP